MNKLMEYGSKPLFSVGSFTVTPFVVLILVLLVLVAYKFKKG